MAEYEHLFIRRGPKVSGAYVLPGTISYTENGEEMPYDGEKIWDVANRKGAEGWEVVSSDRDGNDWELVLKRAKS